MTALMPVICWKTARTIADEEGGPEARLEELAELPFLEGQGVADRGRLRGRRGGLVDLVQDREGLLLPALLQEPARALGDAQDEDEEEDRRGRSRGEHPAPVGRPGADEDPADEIGDEDAADDGHLVDRDQGARGSPAGAISEM